MVQHVLLGAVEEDAGGAVAGEGVVLVGVPQGAGELDELLGAAVAGVVVVVVLEPVVAGGAGVAGGHDVPPRAAGADEVEGGQAAHQVEGAVEAGGRGADEPDPAGLGGQRRQERQRLEPVEVVGRRVRGDELAVDDEEQVEAAALGELGDLGEPGDADAGVAGDVGVEPQRVHAGAAGAVGNRPEVDLPRAGHRLLLSFRCLSTKLPAFNARDPTRLRDPNRSRPVMGRS